MEYELLYYFSLQNDDFILLPITKILLYRSIPLECPNNGMKYYSTPFHSTLSYFISFHSTTYHQSQHTLSLVNRVPSNRAQISVALSKKKKKKEKEKGKKQKMVLF